VSPVTLRFVILYFGEETKEVSADPATTERREEVNFSSALIVPP